jgi:tetratricopeptide (TPR) repeat protein
METQTEQTNKMKDAKKTGRLLFTFATLFFFVNTAFAQQRTNVLVVGTLHQIHKRDSNYTYYDIDKILTAYKPDVICVEIRPEDFRKNIYLKEMMLATIYGTINNVDVYPIDFWNDGHVRDRADSLAHTKEYKVKEKEEKKISENDTVINAFIKKYGTYENVLYKNYGYDFFNGQDFNDFIREEYKISMKVYGDSPINLFYKTRNTKMFDLIAQVVSQNKGHRIIVFTGAEHKHFFDDTLKLMPEVNLVKFAQLLPLTVNKPGNRISDFLENEDDSLYFLPGYPKNMDDYYSKKILALVHGPNMDVDPEKVPQKNIVTAHALLNKWQKEKPQSVLLQSELGNYYFLIRDYDKATETLENVKSNLSRASVESTDPKMKSLSDCLLYLNLGRSYDMKGNRKKAVENYKTGISIINKSNFPKLQKTILRKYMFKNYLKKPYSCPAVHNSLI